MGAQQVVLGRAVADPKPDPLGWACSNLSNTVHW